MTFPPATIPTINNGVKTHVNTSHGNNKKLAA